MNDPNFADFDAADPADDLAAFDAASTETAVPAGEYVCKVERGQLSRTRAGKSGYRLCFSVAEGPHAGFTFWRWHMLEGGSARYSKIALAPLKIATSDDLRRQPFPGSQRTIICKLIVSAKPRPDGTPGNDVERFTVVSDETPPPSRFAVDLDGTDGGTP